jgi:hypothetical protein
VGGELIEIDFWGFGRHVCLLACPQLCCVLLFWFLRGDQRRVFMVQGSGRLRGAGGPHVQGIHFFAMISLDHWMAIPGPPTARSRCATAGFSLFSLLTYKGEQPPYHRDLTATSIPLWSVYRSLSYHETAFYPKPDRKVGCDNLFPGTGLEAYISED